MLDFLIKRFIKNYDHTADPSVRKAYGMLGGVLGIVCNVVLFGLKLTVGLISGSVAAVSDAFNNLSDSGSSVVTVIGARWSAARPDAEHPFGHGRVEYISALVISFIIMFAGIQLLLSSVNKIISPVKPEQSFFLLAVLAFSLPVKLWMYLYNRRLGKRIDSGLLKAAATDSLNDVVAGTVVLVTVILSRYINFPIDGLAGAGVSLLVLWNGFSMAKDTVSLLIGKRADAELAESIKSMVAEGASVTGVHDLIIHDYGPGNTIASVHAEMSAYEDIMRAHEKIDAVERRVYEKTGVELVIHIDPHIESESSERLRQTAIRVVREVHPGFDIHDFRVSRSDGNTVIQFDLTVPYGIRPDERQALVDEACRRVEALERGCTTLVRVDGV